MSLGLMFGHPTESDEVIMRAFKTAQFAQTAVGQQWREAAKSLFESLTPFQKDIIGEILSNPRLHSEAKNELVRLGAEWRNERIDHQTDWVTRSTWPL